MWLICSRSRALSTSQRGAGDTGPSSLDLVAVDISFRPCCQCDPTTDRRSRQWKPSRLHVVARSFGLGYGATWPGSFQRDANLVEEATAVPHIHTCIHVYMYAVMPALESAHHFPIELGCTEFCQGLQKPIWEGKLGENNL